MISRRQIIGGQPTGDEQSNQASSTSSSAASKPSAGRTGVRQLNGVRSSNTTTTNQQRVSSQSKMAGQSKTKLAPNTTTTTTTTTTTSHKNKFKQQRPSSNKMNNSDDYSQMSSFSNHAYEEQRPQARDQVGGGGGPLNSSSFSNQTQDSGQEPFRQQFDPYSADSDEEDVWCSEERLFEDHIEEIYQRWPHLDDDIWCKLIIMERNRRIGKAYARVPIVTIDGSHELSYSGYKLALNGFDNPDRDEETEECRKRIGKGVKIKMDNFGNILIKRMSKASVYVKEWISPAPGISGSSSNSTNASSGAGVGRSMPSRKELIKAASMVGAGHHNHRILSPSSLMNGGIGTPSSSSGGSSMDSPNDSAICDEVLSINGRLELDKIYVMFDIKKFQANINQELCRPYPDRRKLEQQCFSIVGLTRDSEDILNLPCWLMVINIVAIEMLNERLPVRPRAPSFVSIFDNRHQHRAGGQMQTINKEEDPYSLPANASSSDVRSSINDYGTTSTKNMSGHGYAEHMDDYMDPNRLNPPPSRFYAKNVYLNSNDQACDQANSGDLMMPPQQQQRHQSKSRYNIYGPTSKPPGATRYSSNNNSERYNNNSSIYSPGHMLVPHSGDHSVPPKLPPRDFVVKKSQRSKSSSNLSYEDEMKQQQQQQQSENIYSTGLIDDMATGSEIASKTSGQRKVKRNRFLDSLKAPLELAKSNRSASVLDVPKSALDGDQPIQEQAKKSNKTKSGGGFARAKNLRSFLGVGGGGSKSKSSASDDSNYVQVGDNSSRQHPNSTAKLNQQKRHEADSVVDSNEDIDDRHHQAIKNLSSSPDASYNDLDIPTPDYETDENIYALDNGCNVYDSKNVPSNRLANKQQMMNKLQNKSGVSNARTRRNHNNNNDHAPDQLDQMKSPKDDLYYSGFRAHVPNHHHHYGSSTMARGEHQMPPFAARGDDLPTPQTGANNRYLMRTNRMLAAKMNAGGRDQIYGSTLGIKQQQQPSLTGFRYRSASMQRYYSGSALTNQRPGPGSANQMYDPDFENPYAMSASGLNSIVSAGGGMPLDDLNHPTGHYGIGTASSCIGGAGAGRRRSISKQLPMPMGGRVGGSNGNYHDIGRSSSGIYGINSGSSSSEYADFQPQVRKVNSSGYLNSIFKGHHQLSSKLAVGPNEPQMGPTDLTDSNKLESHGKSNSKSVAHHGNYNSNLNKNCDGAKTSQVKNYSSRTLKTTTKTTQATSGGEKLAGSKKKEGTAGLLNGPAYRSYDSSNDSDPSYTNSSDGLDIYDQIGAHANTRPRNLNQQQLEQVANRNHRDQFHDLKLAQSVHVGEWENLYDR